MLLTICLGLIGVKMSVVGFDFEVGEDFTGDGPRAFVQQMRDFDECRIALQQRLDLQTFIECEMLVLHGSYLPNDQESQFKHSPKRQQMQARF